jgi:hypothetical protein
VSKPVTGTTYALYTMDFVAPAATSAMVYATSATAYAEFDDFELRVNDPTLASEELSPF